jgi:HAD superfamily hydrolase (TIGR01490 family)
LGKTLGETLLNGKLQWHYGDKMKRIAIYDMDKTITRKATFGLFIVFVLTKCKPWRLWVLPIMAVVTLSYVLKLISRSRLKEINLRLLMGRRIETKDAQKIAQAFTLGRISGLILPKAEAQIEQDRDAGYRIVLATASYRFYVEAIAASLQISDVIATDCISDGSTAFLPQIEGENCYDEGKLRMVRAWLTAQDIPRESAYIRFYSDHVSDAPCLGWADEAFAVNAHAPLRLLASERGWSILNWM